MGVPVALGWRSNGSFGLDRRFGRGGVGWLGKVVLTAGCASILGATAQAQQAPPVPRPVAPTREEVERPVAERAEDDRPRLTVEGDVERSPCSLAGPEYENLRFTLNDVVFDDLRGLPPEALRPAYAPFVGRELPVSAICEIRDRAGTILRDAGYIAAIEVPEQRVEGGTLRLRVLMARLVGLRVRGNAGRAEQLIAGYLERLTEQEVFNAYEAERYLLLAGDLPGYSVRLTLRSAERGRGEVIGEIFVDRTPATLDFTVQNYGSRDLGRWGGLLRGQLYGLTGLGDRTSLALYSTSDLEEQQTLQLAHDFRIGGEGLGFGGQLTYAWANPDFNDPLVDIESRTLFATVEASFPFIRRQSQTLRGSLGLDYVDQDVDFNDTLINRDQLRVAFLRGSYDAVGLTPGDLRFSPYEPRWRLGMSGELRQGLDIFGATEGCGPALANCPAGTVRPSRAEGDPTATLFRGALFGEVRPVPEFTIAAGVRGQYSGDPLLSFEEFSGGNYSVGRGYDPGAIQGDSGLGLQFELRYGSPYPRTATSFAFQPFVFYEQAWAWNEDRIAPLPRQDLASIGGGVRAAYGDAFRLEVLLAIPLERTLIQPDKDPR
ncbi:MAG: ShlB/FhaC/HecB family hemolysin secretion/activation protein, partial [Allosphingosinicella sp.]